ncbi:PHP domain-containing protein [Micromonospora sp. NPDC049645]|uniref:PHP domain-containing protein n=1 Tax=Micromonospora sp. NPDC049645 TaxID=3155508 RepID=UPI00341F65FE
MKDMLPADSHVHSQWSWDARSGSMEESCRRAVALGVPGVAFTEHVDLTPWTIPAEGIATMPAEFRAMIGADGRFHAPAFDVAGYAEAIDRCRVRYPQLTIRSGVELGEPHWHRPQVRDLLAGYPFDRIIGSLHSLVDGTAFLVVDRAFDSQDADQVMRGYLEEARRMVESSDVFEVLGHLDYPLRAWPAQAGPVLPERFEEQFRAVLKALADTGRTLEINTRGPAGPMLLTWWRDCGGQSVSFGSDAHDPAQVASDFAAAAEQAETAGFRPTRGAELWTRG